MKRFIVLLVLVTLLAACQDQPAAPEAAASGGQGVVSGKVVVPLEDSYVYIYQKGMDLYGPAFAVSRATGPDGRFELPLPDGEYILVVRKRAAGDSAGPVVAGDYKSTFIPVSVAGGRLEMTVEAPMKIGDERQVAKEGSITRTGLTGFITDIDGKPVEGARVHVYDHVQMSERPKFVSEKTGADGAYIVYLPEGGTYYIAARDKFGGPPKIGDLYGRYDQGTIEPSAVVVRDEEILKGVNITVTKVW
ncbi:MAG: hypothetical protein C0624_04660 [Desulfuromonas sp.]|nr:MAG: hypothetical protein C0624_04660 [Desulfuromonas sp.]